MITDYGKLFFNLRRKKKDLGWFTDAEVKAVAKDLNVSTKDVLQILPRNNIVFAQIVVQHISANSQITIVERINS